MSWLDYISPYGKKSPLKGLNNSLMKFWTGTPEKHERVSTLREDQEPLSQQLVNAGLNPGAGGAFGTSADYYRDLLSDDSQTAQAMFAPEMRRFNEDIIPGLSEQFAGMGAGGLSSSGFQNASVNAGTDLSERLGAIRANLKAQGAAGLAGIGQMGLQSFTEDKVTQPGSQGFLSTAAPIAGGIIGTAVGGPLGGAIGTGAASLFNGGSSNVGKNSSPYGAQSQAGAPSQGMSQRQPMQLPNFRYR